MCVEFFMYCYAQDYLFICCECKFFFTLVLGIVNILNVCFLVHFNGIFLMIVYLNIFAVGGFLHQFILSLSMLLKLQVSAYKSRYIHVCEFIDT